MQLPPANNHKPFPDPVQFAKRLKKILVTLTAFFLFTLAILFYAFVVRPKNQIDVLHAKYLTVDRPSTYTKVLQTMGPTPTSDEPGQGTAFWDDEYPSSNLDESKNITHILRYSIPGLPYSVTFEFTFDKDKNLIGKHRYD